MPRPRLQAVDDNRSDQNFRAISQDSALLGNRVTEAEERLDDLEILETVRGIVKIDGTIVEGTEYTAEKLGKGELEITFSPAFSDVPAVTTAPVNTLFAAPLGAVSKSSAVIYGFTSAAALEEGTIHFTAVGPR